MKSFQPIAVLVLASSLLFSSCTATPPQDGIVGDIADKINQTNADGSPSLVQRLKDQQRIKRFKDQEEFKTFLTTQVTEGGMNGGIQTLGRMDSMVSESTTGAMAPEAVKSGGPTTGGGTEEDFSTTNVQVEGVDEGDIMKSDGTNLYYLHESEISIVDASNPSELKEQSMLKFEERPQGMYISGDRLVVYGTDYGAYELSALRSMPRGNGFSYVEIYDTSDKTAPKKLTEYSFEGNYKDSRLIGEQLVLITDKYSYGGQPYPGVPVMLRDDQRIAETSFPYTYYFDLPYSSVNMTTVSSLNVRELGEPQREVYLLPNSGELYVSEDHLYMTYGKYIDENEVSVEVGLTYLKERLPEAIQKKLTEIDTVSEFILTDKEKLYKKGQLAEQYVLGLPEEEQKVVQEEIEALLKKQFTELAKEMQKTVIHKISLAGGKIEYKAGGEVVGTPLNQFSMDQDGEYFRIATTKNQIWSQYVDEADSQSDNNMYVLNKDMQVVGSLTGLAKGERIYSVRFMQDRAYMVTFKQVDPLFVIDLKNPTEPKVLGELKIPGFSNYLHPYDQNHIIGVGRDADENKFGNVQAQGVKISLFDVSDVSNPKENAQYIVEGEGTYSDALNDHKAVLFSKEKNLLVLPITEQKSYRTGIDFQGAMVFSIDKNSIALKGKVEHEGAAVNTQKPFNGDEPVDILPRVEDQRDYMARIDRTAYIGETLFTFSQRMLKSTGLNNLEQLGVLRW